VTTSCVRGNVSSCGSMLGHAAKKVAVHSEDRRVIGVAKAGSAGCHRHKHPPEICWRACNDLEDVRGCGLLLARLGELAPPLLD
jgi:hypothetical protein